MTKRLFITGTDTEVGKTVISASLVFGLKASYWKPIQAGLPADTDWIRQVTGFAEPFFHPERYRLRDACSPHLAARNEGLSISLDDFELPQVDQGQPLVVEGCGGIFVPINERGDLLIDLIEKFRLPTLIVCRSTLGTLNHTLLTIDTLKRAGIPLAGVVMNGPKQPENRRAIERFGALPVLGEIERQTRLDQTSLHLIYQGLSL